MDKPQTPENNSSRNSLSRPIRNERGSALMMAIAAVTFLMVIASEVAYETSVEYLVSAQKIKEAKAYYAARAGMEINLLRIFIFKQAISQFGSALPNKGMLDPIWQMPFTWPPMLPDGTSEVDKDQIQTSVKNSNMQGSYVATIESESNKIDINDLASSSKTIREATYQRILKIFEDKIEADDNWAKEYGGFDFKRLLNDIADWVDDDSQALNGGDEKTPYAELQADKIPPNQPFKTLQELHMVHGMTDEIYNLLAPQITVYGSKAINVNYAKKEVLMTLAPGITLENANRILERIQDAQKGPFKDLEDFKSFLGTLAGVDARNIDKMPLIFSDEYNFRLVSIGTSGQVQKKITAIVYDYDQVKESMKTLMKNDETQQQDPSQVKPPEQQNPTGQNPDSKKDTDNKAKAMSSGPPTVVYWFEE